jgi:ATP-dependent RNA helicase HelY
VTPSVPGSGELTRFERSLAFRLDDFQREACAAIAAGDSVLVAAPTGAGKTVIADFGVFLTRESGVGRIFYTTPIKALSNQKFHEFQHRYGPEQVGLLTGDTNINAESPIVVMTTEVLRNMIYEGSSLLEDLEFVVLDEVHYLGDHFRGPVWEEVIIGLPERVRLISLSATVSNAEEFGSWLQDVRGRTRVIVSEFRPVPLAQHILVQDTLEDLFVADDGRGRPRVNPRLDRVTRLLEDAAPLGRSHPGRRHGRGRPRRGGRPGRVNRATMVRVLEDADLLPVISFIFSRTGCDAAVQQCLAAGIDLTNREERLEIDRIVEEHCGGIPESDRPVLGFAQWRRALLKGLAAHHAGLLPAFKETVEELFQRRLVRVVFATETLALGINMPARTVALERLEKFNGEARVPITPGEYTQLTGRAGRRGIDTRGDAVVVWHPGMDVHRVASLASRRTFPLRSSFHPTYNMSVNLIAQFGRDATREILESSFAQYQADRAVVGLSRRLRELREALEGYAASAGFDDSGVRGYYDLREQQRDLEHRLHRLRRQDPHQEAVSAVRGELTEVRHRLQTHPEHVSAARERHARWAQRYFRTRREADSLESQISARTENIAATFDTVVEILSDRGYLTNDEGTTTVTESGQVLARIYGDRDLLIAECLHRGLWSALTVPELVAVVTGLAAEPRREQLLAHAPEPGGAFPRVFDATCSLWDSLTRTELAQGLPGTPEPSAVLSGPLFRWAAGAPLESVLHESSMVAGDFVRLVKQVMDLLDQIAQTGVEGVSERARAGGDAIRRGIVAYSIASERG